jgi:hypothetical protein
MALRFRSETPATRRAATRGWSFPLVALGGLLLLQPVKGRAAVPPSDVALNSTSVRQGQPAGTIVAILKEVASDTEDSHIHTLVAGEGAEDNPLFAISGDTLRTAAVLNYTNQSRFSIRLRTMDDTGGSFERQLTVAVTPPSMVAAMDAYLAVNPAVANAAVALFDKETLDYFWVYQNALAANGTIQMDVPVNTPADTATTGTTSVYLSSIERDRILAAKTAHAIWVDRNGLVPWRLADYSAANLDGLFAKATLFNPQSSTVFFFRSVVDYSPTDAWRYAVSHGLIRPSVQETINAVLDDLRSDLLHGSAGFGDPTCAYRLLHALNDYSPTRFRPARIARSGCHSSSRLFLALLRCVNIPGYETTSGEYFLGGHSEAVVPCVGKVLPHGDHLYSADLTATPVDELMPPFQFFTDNAGTPPAFGNKYGIAIRYVALRGTSYPTPTILAGVRNPASYGYSTPVEFLNGYAGWGQGLTAAELDAAANTLLTQYNETRHLTLPAETSQGTVLNNPNPPSANYVKDSRLLLKAVPNDAWAFSHWTGDVPAGMKTANPLVLTMETDKAIQAVFTRPPAVASIVKSSEDETFILFTVLAGLSYTVEYRADLEAGSWQTLTNLPPQISTGVITSQDPAQPMPARRFYRVVTH